MNVIDQKKFSPRTFTQFIQAGVSMSKNPNIFNSVECSTRHFYLHFQVHEQPKKVSSIESVVRAGDRDEVAILRHPCPSADTPMSVIL